MVSFKGVVLTIGIAAILTLFIHYGLKTFLKKPVYGDFCETEYIQDLDSQIREECDSKFPPVYELCPTGVIAPYSGEFSDIDDWIEKIKPMVPEESQSKCESIWRKYYQKECDCRVDYDKAQKSYEQTRFIVLITLGAATIVAGGLMFTFEGIGTGILGGGIITAISGTVSYWRYLGEVVRFLMLGFVLAVLIGIGIIVALKEKEKRLKEKEGR